MSQLAKPTILVAEDDPVFRHLLQFTIEKAGYRVIAACDGETAWQHWQTNAIDFLVTDHQMPHCSGLELVQRIAESWPLPDQVASDGQRVVLPILLCTAKGMELSQDDFESRHEILGVFGKPFSPKTLVQRLEQHFGPRANDQDQEASEDDALDRAGSATANAAESRPERPGGSGTLPTWSYSTGPVNASTKDSRPAVWSATESFMTR